MSEETTVQVTQADMDAVKAYQQRFLTEGVSETELLGETLARHRIAAEAGKAELVEALEFLADVARAMPNFSPMALSQADAALAKAKGDAA